VIRIGATIPALAASIEAFTGIFTADGQPFRYRTLDDYLRVVSLQDVVAMLRQRATHTAGQLLTSSELARFVHLPDRAAAGPVHLSFMEFISTIVPGGDGEIRAASEELAKFFFDAALLHHRLCCWVPAEGRPVFVPERTGPVAPRDEPHRRVPQCL